MIAARARLTSARRWVPRSSGSTTSSTTGRRVRATAGTELTSDVSPGKAAAVVGRTPWRPRRTR
ncbi:hypothetical protein [Saccharopolyspora hordei]|uniref:Uncharacterized protein n=1 Tax=Saccharopolyspora hordei TaxID=1838 RepID=A0A853AQF8_9PSEU|nr:hypothetical protein [Saccharopolyspora hordei]NYI83060.1 hypothetical protein [Saccharopolyspora hordei]